MPVQVPLAEQSLQTVPVLPVAVKLAAITNLAADL